MEWSVTMLSQVKTNTDKWKHQAVSAVPSEHYVHLCILKHCHWAESYFVQLVLCGAAEKWEEHKNQTQHEPSHPISEKMPIIICNNTAL